MKARAAILVLALASAAAVSLPARSRGFQTLGLNLNADRIGFQTNPASFTNPASNNNAAFDPNWPAGTGADLAIRKAASEWSSQLRGGTGAGDPLQANGVGSGASNFDFQYEGITAAAGGLTSAVARAGGLLGVGVFAVTQTYATGWNMVFDNSVQNGWVWEDGPGSEVDNAFKVDIQGIATHEFGHALGLGHSDVPSATMIAITSTAASVNLRSIEPDDVLGVQSIYGPKLATKPEIFAVTGPVTVGGQITITGVNFSATGNEVWLTKKTNGATTTGPMTPVKITGLASTAGGTSIALTIPVGVAPGDVIVHRSGASSDQTLKSAPFPFPLVPASPGPPTITSISPNPAPIAASIPPVITILGANLASATQVAIGAQTYSGGQLTVVDDNQLRVTFLPPPKDAGAVNLTITNPLGTSAPSPITLALATSRFLFPSTSTPTAGGSLTLYLACPAPGNIPLLGFSSCLGISGLPPFFTFFIGGCGDLQFASLPVFDSAGVTSITFTIPATFHGAMNLQFADTDALLSTIPFPTSTFLQLVIP